MRGLLLCSFLLVACSSAQEQAAPFTTASNFLPVNGGRIYYEVAGSGPAVVLLHGGFGDRRMWDPQFTALARSFRVVRYDHRGFGRSPAPDSAYSPLHDLVQLLDHLDIDKAHLVGNSMSAALVLSFALLHPDRINRVVASAGGAGGYPYTEADFASVAAVFTTAQQQGVDSAGQLWLRNPMIAVSSRHERSADLVRRMVEENRAIFLMQHWPEEALTPRAYERMSELRVPVLFVVGENDTPLVQRVAEATAARVPGSQLWRVPGADHLPHLVAPELFNQRIAAFLQGEAR
ncbi:MAG TPA: alpha/beta hydrolase [Longimicrobiales bacterium]|nr:alpha/beta hydrolase [Longimicrobiales bacterium]